MSVRKRGSRRVARVDDEERERGVAVAGEVITTSRLVLCPSDLPSCPRQEHGTDVQWHGDSRGAYFRQPGRGRIVILGLRPVKGRSKVHSLSSYTFNSPHHHHSPVLDLLSLSLSVARRAPPPPTQRAPPQISATDAPAMEYERIEKPFPVQVPPLPHPPPGLPRSAVPASATCLFLPQTDSPCPFGSVWYQDE